MVSPRPRRTFIPLFIALVGILCFFSAPARASSQPAPSSESDLICHTSDPNDCYPRIFQPTDEFQPIRDDQDIPGGLHVRMNMYTGTKEAKINVPGEGDDQAVLVVDQEQDDAPQIPKGAPAYEAVGKIKEPRHEASSFADAMKMVKGGLSQNEGAFDVALEAMEDISHDMYYGLKITEDVDVLKSLFCLMADPALPVPVDATPRDQQAAAILAGALQNNPAALKEVAQAWSSIMESPCPQDGTPLSNHFYASFVPAERADEAQAKTAANRVKAEVSAINGLIKDDAIRAEFLKNGGMSRLLEVLVPEGNEWATAQRKAGQLVLDNFLDEDMGAKLGQWPQVPKSDAKVCQGAETQTGEGCWDYHVERVMKMNKWDESHWSKDLHGRLAAVRKRDGAPEHVEL